MAQILLQMKYQGFGGGQGSAPSVTTYIIIGGVIGAIVLVVLIINLVKKRKGDGKAKKFKKATFKRDGRKTGLSDQQINIMLGLIRKQEVKTPYKLLQNSGLLDSTLHQAMTDIEESDLDEDAKESRRHAIYSIKQTVERNAKSKNTISNTKGLQHGQTIILVIEGRRYRTMVIKNLKETFQVEAPVTAGGKRIILPRWSRISAQFWKKEGEMFAFETKVVSIKNDRGVPNYFLQHSKKVTISQQRRFRRVELAKPVYFGLVSIVTTGSGRRQTKQAVIPNKRNALGTLLDISSGGCSLKTTFPIKRGELIRLQFEIERRKPVVAFGKVVSIHKQRPAGNVMHVQFTKVTRKNLNEINAVIYEGVSGKS